MVTDPRRCAAQPSASRFGHDREQPKRDASTERSPSEQVSPLKIDVRIQRSIFSCARPIRHVRALCDAHFATRTLPPKAGPASDALGDHSTQARSRRALVDARRRARVGHDDFVAVGGRRRDQARDLAMDLVLRHDSRFYVARWRLGRIQRGLPTRAAHRGGCDEAAKTEVCKHAGHVTKLAPRRAAATRPSEALLPRVERGCVAQSSVSGSLHERDSRGRAILSDPG